MAVLWVTLCVLGYGVIGLGVARVCLHFDADLKGDDVVPGFIVIMWPAIVATVLFVLFVLTLCGLGRLVGAHPQPPWK